MNLEHIINPQYKPPGGYSTWPKGRLIKDMRRDIAEVHARANAERLTISPLTDQAPKREPDREPQ